LVIAPLVIEYSSTYKKVRQADGSVVSYHFHIARPNKDGSGGLQLDAATYCAIFNGQITDWNQIPTTLNGGVSLKDPADTSTFSVPLQIVGRSDSAGATSTWTRHLAAICPGVITGNQYADSATTLPTALQGPAWTSTNPNYGAGSGVTDVPGKYTRALQTVGVADYIQFDPNNLPGPNAGDSVVQGRIGYNGADTALPYVNNTGNNTFGLNVVDIRRAGTTGIEASAATALLAYNSTILPPTGANAQSPANWVQPASKTAAVAIPSNIKAYPIVGTTNFLGYTCYTDAGVTSNLIAFLKWYTTSLTVEDPKLGILAKSGSSPMPTAWRTSIKNTFLLTNTTTNPLNLHILQAGTGPSSGTNSQCSAITPGA
jgi:ABC-type phosphate transport system substrate-binding protein